MLTYFLLLKSHFFSAHEVYLLIVIRFVEKKPRVYSLKVLNFMYTIASIIIINAIKFMLES